MSYGFSFPVSFSQGFDHSLVNNTYTQDVALILKQVNSDANVDGNTGISNAKADAFGENTIAETVNTTWAIEHAGSGAYGSSVSATDTDYHYYW